MKKILTIFLCLIPWYVYSGPFQKDTTVVCSELSSAFETLFKDYKEKPIWIGVDQNKNKFALVANKETGTWSFLQFNTEIACALGTGVAYEILYTGPII